MGVGFNWFKGYEIIEIKVDDGWDESIEYGIEYLNCDNTSHGYGSRTKLQNIFKKYIGVEIPTISGYWFEKPEINLIEPSIMSSYCEKLLSNKEYELEDMEDRVQWIKKLSDKGFYVSYDML